MNAPQHALIGLIVGLVASQFLLVEITPPLIIIILFGALLPDVDHRKTKMFKVALISILIGSFVIFRPMIGLVKAIIASIVSTALFFVFKPRHRGITHTVFAATIYALILYLADNPSTAIIGFIAYFSHLVTDKQIKLI